MTESGGVVTATLGAAVTTSSGDRQANFNIAATQFYIDAVAAAQASGAAGVTLTGPTWAATTTDEHTGFGVSASNGQSVSQNLYLTRSSGWVSGTRYVYLRTDSTSGTQRARIAVYMPSVSEASWTWDTPAPGYLRATIRIGGSTYSSSHAV